ncbi:MAG: tRNA 2-thiocytidine(32) synthetase TtcA [Endomicrobia bacterium]|nr:tRNA 2-thiocytidine(32) synthetase TtcA [Endomicrobiia bacterium]
MNKTKLIQQVERKVGKALGDYKMIKENDKILVAVSGGKDSLTLLEVLKNKQKILPVKFDIFAVYINFGFYSKEEFTTQLENYFLQNSIKYYIIKKTLSETHKKKYCFWCSWNRRKEIFLLAKQLGCGKVAFGHTLDDIAVTFLMNVFYHGEISTMSPVVKMFNGEIYIIRPLVYVTEEETQKYAEYKNLPVNKFQCPYYYDENTIQHRKYLSNLLLDLQKYWPNIKLNIFNSLKKIKLEYLV